MRGAERLQFSYLKVIPQLAAELTACGAYTEYDVCRCSLVSHGRAAIPSDINTSQKA